MKARAECYTQLTATVAAAAPSGTVVDVGGGGGGGQCPTTIGD